MLLKTYGNSVSKYIKGLIVDTIILVLVMKTIKELLQKDEFIVYEARPHWASLLWPIIGGIASCIGEMIWVLWDLYKQKILEYRTLEIEIIFAVLMCLFIVKFILSYMAYNNFEMAITNRRIIVKSGSFGGEFIDHDLNKIESIHVDQGLFKSGSIVFNGKGGKEYAYGLIRDPFIFKIKLEETKLKYCSKSSSKGLITRLFDAIFH